VLEGEPRAEGLDLTNGVTIEVATASYRATRGYAIVAALCDELAFWPTDDSADPTDDRESPVCHHDTAAVFNLVQKSDDVASSNLS
jgi:hypothetical protein